MGGPFRDDKTRQQQTAWAGPVTARAAWAKVSALCVLTGLLVAAMLTATAVGSTHFATVEPGPSVATLPAPL